MEDKLTEVSKRLKKQSKHYTLMDDIIFGAIIFLAAFLLIIVAACAPIYYALDVLNLYFCWI